MSSVAYLREFVNERLTAAVEEIFRVFEKTIAEHEEEIDRQRKLLDIVWKPEIKLHRIELPQQHVCKEEEVVADQQLCIQERNSSLDQEDPEPPQIKEEQGGSDHSEDRSLDFNPDKSQSTAGTELLRGMCISWLKVESDCENPQVSEPNIDHQLLSHNSQELCTSQEGEQLELKQETETFMLTPTHEESDHSEDQILDLIPDKKQSAAETELPASLWVSWLKDKSDHKNPQVSEPNRDYQLLSLSSHVAERQDQKRRKNEDSGSTRNAESKLEKSHCQRRSHINIVSNQAMSMVSVNSQGKKSFECSTCGKAFKYKSHLQRHLITHTGEKPYLCKTCGMRFGHKSALKIHARIHTGEKPYVCETCGKRFCQTSTLKAHIRTHTGEKPHLCKICGMRFGYLLALKSHARTHTGERP